MRKLTKYRTNLFNIYIRMACVAFRFCFVSFGPAERQVTTLLTKTEVRKPFGPNCSGFRGSLSARSDPLPPALRMTSSSAALITSPSVAESSDLVAIAVPGALGNPLGDSRRNVKRSAVAKADGEPRRDALKQRSTSRSPRSSDNAAGDVTKVSKKSALGFQLLSERLPKPCVPKASDIVFTTAWAAPTAMLARQIGSGSEVLMGIDIETADWPDPPPGGNKGNVGQFGFYNLCAPADLNQRCVQLGWVMGRSESLDVKKEYLIQPADYIIAKKATEFHKITHAAAEACGRPLRDVLVEFIDDVRELLRRSGRIACHHLEFDCGILAQELTRCDLMEQRTILKQAACSGLCTMDPEVGRYVLERMQQEGGPESAKNAMSLRTLVNHICPQFGYMLKNHHSAGVDAELHYNVARALQRLAAPPAEAVGVLN